jgi:hypothetical protein
MYGAPVNAGDGPDADALARCPLEPMPEYPAIAKSATPVTTAIFAIAVFETEINITRNSVKKNVETLVWTGPSPEKS